MWVLKESGNCCEKYRPKLLSEIVGNAKPVSELSLWAKGWQQGTPGKMAAILYGKPGIGKTTAAHALAHDLGWDLIELNASEQRQQFRGLPD
jgi:replication factor C large subunit